jgi:hypothetical protein
VGNVVDDIRTLELSAAAYDEIERKLLEAGYDWVIAKDGIWLGDLQTLTLTREKPPEPMHPYRKQYAAAPPPPGSDYCFQCDQVVTKPCDREYCLTAINIAVRADLGLERHR